MKTNLKLSLLLITLQILLMTNMKAQTWCGAPEIDLEADTNIAGAPMGIVPGCGQNYGCDIPSNRDAHLYTAGLPVLKIPVMIHLIRDDQGNGMTVQDVDRIMNDMNKFYRGQRAIELGYGPGYDTGIEFCWNINVVNNTTYYTTPVFNWYNQIITLPDYQINVFLSPVSGWQGVAGFASYPYIWMQSGATFDPFQARALSHEMGHYLGLGHTDAGYGPYTCQDNHCQPASYSDELGDRCSDTPPEAMIPGSVVPVLLTDMCSGAPVTYWTENHKNIMSYGGYASVGYFTPQQTARMRCRVNTFMSSLFTYIGQFCPGGITAAFTGNPTTICTGGIVSFTDQSSLSATNWLWNFGDGTTSTLQNPQHIYNFPGIYDVTLVVTDAVGQSTMTTFYEYVSVSSGVAVPYTEQFNTPNSISVQNQWTTQNMAGLPGGNSWTWNNSISFVAAGQTSTPSPYDIETMFNGNAYTAGVGMNFPFMDPSGNVNGAVAINGKFTDFSDGDIDALYSPVFDLSGVNNPEITFSFSHLPSAYFANLNENCQFDYPGLLPQNVGCNPANPVNCGMPAGSYTNNSLEVQITNDCGTTWQTIWTRSGENLNTVPGKKCVTYGFAPLDSSSWDKVTLPLCQTGLTGKIRVRFVYTSDEMSGATYFDDFCIGSGTNPNAFTTNVSLADDCGAGNGVIAALPVGGQSPFTYALSNDSTAQTFPTNQIGVFENLFGGSYTLIITDALGNCATESVTLPLVSSLPFTTNVSGASCQLPNGSVAIAITTPLVNSYNYTLYDVMMHSLAVAQNTGANYTFFNLPQGMYWVAVEDTINSICGGHWIQVGQATQQFSFTTVPENCSGAGSIAVANPPAGTFTYTLTPGGITNTSGVFNNLASNMYQVAISGNNNFCEQQWVEVEEAGLFMASVSGSVTCEPATFGSINIHIDSDGGGTMFSVTATHLATGTTCSLAPTNQTYIALTPQNGCNIFPGTYLIVVQNNLGCSQTLTTTLANPNPMPMGTEPTVVYMQPNVPAGIPTGAVSAYVPSCQYYPGNSKFWYWLVSADTLMSVTNTMNSAHVFYGVNPGIYNLNIQRKCSMGRFEYFQCDTRSLVMPEEIRVLTGCDAGGPGLEVHLPQGTGMNWTVSVYPWGMGTTPAPLSGTGPVFAFPNLLSDNYTVVISNGAGISTQYNAFVPVAPSYTYTTTSACGTNGSLEITPSGGVAPYTLNIAGLNNLPAGNGPFIFTGIAGGTYTGTIVDAIGNCVSVSAEVIQSASIPYVAYTVSSCSGSDGEVNIMVDGFNGVYTANLDGPVSQTQSPGLNLVFQGLTAGNYTGFLTDTSGGCEVLNFDIQDIECCTFPTSDLSFVDRPASWLISQNPGQTLYENLFISINGTFNVDQSISFKNCMVFMGPGSKINVEPGKVFLSDSSTFQACGYEMWGGFTTSDPAALIELTNGTVVKDALIGIHSVNGGNYLVENCTMDMNHVDMKVEDYAGIHQGKIFSSHLICSAPISLVPHAGEYTNYGISVHNVDSLTIGGFQTTQGQVIFDGVMCGIFAGKSNLKVDNCEFNNIQMGLGGPSAGTGIKMVNGGQGNTSPYYFSLGADAKNAFENCLVGIDIRGNGSGHIANNVFNHVSDRGISVMNSDATNLLIENNKITNTRMGVYFNTMNNVQALVKRNNIQTSVLQVSRGISLEMITSSGTDFPVKISENIIEHSGAGIFLNATEHAVISGNTLNTAYGLNYEHRAINVQGGAFNQVFQNYIHGDIGLAGSDLVKGIWIQESANNFTTCNEIKNHGWGVTYFGYSPGTLFKNNTMTNGKIGFTLFESEIGAQGSYGTPSDNKWTGTFSHSWVDSRGSDGATSPFYIRNQGAYNFAGYSTTSVTMGVNTPTAVIPIATNLTGNVLENNCNEFENGVVNNAALVAIAGGNDVTGTYSRENEWKGNDYLLESVALDPTLISREASVEAKWNQIENSNHGVLRHARQNMIFGSLADGIQQNSSVNPQNRIEENLKAVLDILSSSRTSEGWNCDSVQVAELYQIANQCPQLGGPAVYESRAILSSLGKYMQFTNSCEEGNDFLHEQKPSAALSNETNMTVYPNPTPDVAHFRNENDNSVKVEIWSELQVKIADLEVQANGTGEINLAGFASGLYLWKAIPQNTNGADGKISSGTLSVIR